MLLREISKDQVKMMVHPTAIIHPEAEIGEELRISRRGCDPLTRGTFLLFTT